MFKKILVITAVVLFATVGMAYGDGGGGGKGGGDHYNIHPNIHNNQHHNTIIKNNKINTGDNITNNNFKPTNVFKPENTNTNINTNLNCNKNENTNINKNKNVNNNTNKQAQGQGQAQGQAQGQGQGQAQQNVLTIEDERELLAAPNVVFAGLSNYTGSEKPGYTYQTLEEMLEFGNVFTREQLENMADHRGIRPSVVDVTSLNTLEKQDTLTIYVKKGGFAVTTRTAFITVAMKSVKGISVECVGKSGLASLDSGANAMYLNHEGWDLTQSQHAFSFGPGGSYSKVMPDAGASGGLGLSYSYGVFGKNYKPYTRFTALSVTPIVK